MKLSTTAAVIAAALAFSVDRAEARLGGRGLDEDFMGNQNGHVNRQPIQRQTNVFYDSEDLVGNQNGHVNRQPIQRQTNFFYDNGDYHKWYAPRGKRGVKKTNFFYDNGDYHKWYAPSGKRLGNIRLRGDADDDILGDPGPRTPFFKDRAWTFRGDADEDLGDAADDFRQASRRCWNPRQCYI